MPSESCVSAFLTYPQQQQQPFFHHQHGSLEHMHFMISESKNGIKQEAQEEPSDLESGEEDSTFADKWPSAKKSWSEKFSLGETDSSENDQLKPSEENQVPDVVSLGSRKDPEGANTPSASGGGRVSSPCPPDSPISPKEASQFLFFGPLGKKRKYSRQRTASDDNESQLQIVTGSPETVEEEMDQSQSPSHGDNSQSSLDNQEQKGISSAQEEDTSAVGESSGVDEMTRSEPVSSVITPTQRSTTTSESGAESTGENSNLSSTNTSQPSEKPESSTSAMIISKPIPIIGAPTSVIRRVHRKKQEHPLNLSVSSPPGSLTFSSSSESSNLPPSASPAGRASAIVRTEDDQSAASVVRDELYFDGRTPGDRQVFVWRYREDVTGSSPLPSAAGAMSPSLSNISSSSFLVPDVLGAKLGSSGASSSASSGITNLLTGHDETMTNDETDSNYSSGKPKKRLRCNDCGKEFSQLRNYRYHRSRHEGSNQFSCTCPVCGKQFNDRGYLSSHMKIHRNAKEYRCEYCSKGFNQRVAYNMHRRIHTGHRPHHCDVCGKSFSRRMLLKQHMRIHTGERPYSCSVCNKAFADRSNMLLHQRLHSGERPYACEICKKTFSKNHHLKTHMNHHAGIKPYECTKCHARFSQSSNMKTHMKKCSGVPNPTTTQRQQIIRRNTLEMSRSGTQMETLPLEASGNPMIRGKEPLPSLSGASRLVYKQQQSFNVLTQSINGTGGMLAGPATASPLSPAHSRGQVPIESLLLHLNVGRSRNPSQSSMHSGTPLSPTSGVSLNEFQMMLRNAAVAAASTASRPMPVSNHGTRAFSSSTSPLQSSIGIPSAAATTSGMIPSFGGLIMSSSAVTNTRYSPPGGGNVNEQLHQPSTSPMMAFSPNIGLAGYGLSPGSRSQMDATSMPPPPTSGANVLRNIPTPSSFMHPDLLPPSPSSMLRIDTRSLDSIPSIGSPPDRPGSRQRIAMSPLVSPRRTKQPSPPSLSNSGSFIPLSTLESAALASGLRSPSQMVRFLSSALREAENPLQTGSHASTRLPSLPHHQNVLEAMVAAANAEQGIGVPSSSPAGSGTIRIRQNPSPQVHAQQQSHSAFQYSGESAVLPSLQLSQSAPMMSGGSPHSTMGNMMVTSPPPYSVITSPQLLQQQQEQQHSLNNMQRGVGGTAFTRFVTTSSASSAVSRLASTLEGHHSPADQAQHIELQQQQLAQQQHRPHGYHQSLLQNRVSQGTVPTPGYPVSSSGGYSVLNHSIISRSRSHSPGTTEQIRERNPNYQNQ